MSNKLPTVNPETSAQKISIRTFPVFSPLIETGFLYLKLIFMKRGFQVFELITNVNYLRVKLMKSGHLSNIKF